MTIKYLIAILFFTLIGCKSIYQTSQQKVENAITKNALQLLEQKIFNFVSVDVIKYVQSTIKNFG